MRLAAVLLLAVSLAGCFRLSVPETHYQRRVFVNALRADPDLAHAHWMLGRRAMLDGEYREAIYLRVTCNAKEATISVVAF